MKLDSRAVANFFIEQSVKEGSPVTHLKVQKLVYISQGWYLGITKERLVDEAVEAWQHGPVFRSLYEALKKWGARAITESIRGRKGEDFRVTDEHTRKYLKAVWERYREYSAGQLSEMSHEPGTPWSQTKRPFWSLKHKIDDDVISNYYRGRLIDNGAPL